MQKDMPGTPADPFQGAHRAAQRKADKDAAAQQIVARDQRILTSEAKRKIPKVEQGYLYSGPFYR